MSNYGKWTHGVIKMAEKTKTPLTAHEDVLWSSVCKIVSEVFATPTEGWCYGHDGNFGEERFAMPRAVTCYIAKHENGLNWGTSRIRVALSDTPFMKNQNTVLSAVRTCRNLLSCDGGVYKWAMIEVIRRFCEINSIDLDAMLPPCRLEL